jgi:hypothetical protein
MITTRRPGAPLCASAVIGLLAFSSANSSAAESRWPKSADELEVTLKVEEALEDGPVVCKVTLKNVGKDSLKYGHGTSGKGAFCRPAGNWKARKEPTYRIGGLMGRIGPFERRLEPGQSDSELFYLHKGFLSIPSGRARLAFGWNVNGIVLEAREKGERQEVLDLLFRLKGEQNVDILPATEKNVLPVLGRLEAQVSEIVKQLDADRGDSWGWTEPVEAIVQTFKDSRHSQFVPLMILTIDRLPLSASRSELVEMVYECFATSRDGFDALFAYLSSSDIASADDVFEYWSIEERRHEYRKECLAELKEPLILDRNPEKADLQKRRRESLSEAEEVWKAAKRHLDTRLTNEQINRLCSIKSVWVRALLYAHFPKRCPKEWIAKLFGDLEAVARPPARFQELMKQLDDDSFRVREEATAALIASGPTFAWHLWAVPKVELSLEAAARLEKVLKQVKKPELPRLWRRTIFHLGWYKEAPYQKVLNALRETDCPNLISQAAQEAYEGRR